MSEKILEFVGFSATDSDATITFPRKVRVKALQFRWVASATVGNRLPGVEYLTPPSANSYGFAFTTVTIAANLSSLVFGAIGMGLNAPPLPFTHQVIDLPNVEIAAGGQIAIGDLFTLTVNDTINSVVLTYDDGLMEDDPDPPTIAT